MEAQPKANETQEQKKIKPRYVVGLRYGWTGHAKNKKEAEMFARQEFFKKLKNINDLRMNTEVVEEIHE
jgi:hypothetical protein